MKIEDIGLRPEEFPAKLKYFREQIKGWSRERMARELGVTAQSIYRWERGRNYPNSDIVIRNLVNARFLE